MRVQDFRGNCDSQGKLGMCPSLAEPYTIGFPKGIISHETKNTAPRENGLQRPAKGGFTPAFACQRAAIAPLPCLNLQPSSLSFNFVRIGSFKKCNCSRENKLQNSICFANVGYSPTPRQHF